MNNLTNTTDAQLIDLYRDLMGQQDNLRITGDPKRDAQTDLDNRAITNDLMDIGFEIDCRGIRWQL